jgi:superfamily I DNA/RNA helicase/DNA polymerase III epsilon subunit-like protein
MRDDRDAPSAAKGSRALETDRQAKLSAEQARVVDHDPRGGHVLVLARPGSGKTHTLAARAARLLRDGVDPRHLLAMTFSRRAAEGLKDRLPGGRIWAGTIHAICADILEEHGAAIGIRWPFRIFDEVRSREVLERAASEADLAFFGHPRERTHLLSELGDLIERRKRQGRVRIVLGEGSGVDIDAVERVDAAYNRLLREANALDFADLIAKAVLTLQEDDQAAEALRRRLAYLLVDEVHDISPEQYQLIALLAPARAGCQVFVVGDPDQAIYGWRGADCDAILRRYRREYCPTEFELTVNFRSQPPIVSAADACLREAGRTRPSQPARTGHVRPGWCPVQDAQAEAREVANSIERAARSGSVSGYGAFAVLYRTHAVGDTVEAELLRRDVPLWRVQRQRFFDDRDAQESLRYLELAFGLHDLGFEPALNWPRVIVDEVTMVQLRRLAAQRSVRLIELVREVEGLGCDLSPLTRGAIREFVASVGRDLAPLVDLSMTEALTPFLRALAARRSPIPQETRAILRDTLDFLEGSLREAVPPLLSAVRCGRPIAVHALHGPDAVAAAAIVRYALERYYDVVVADDDVDHRRAGAFLLTLGEDRIPSEDEIGISILRTRTVTVSVATRAWRLMQMLLMADEQQDRGRFLLFDVETTNLHPARAEILEFGVVPFAGGAVAGAELVSLVRPSGPKAIDPVATDTHGLRWRDVSHAPVPGAILPTLVDTLEGETIVGHNIDDFDLPVLKRAAERAGCAFHAPFTLDTRKMAERLWPGEASYRLEDLARRADAGVTQRHRARDDCLLTGQVFSELLQAARRDRELDVLSECLPLVAASILVAGCDVVNDNTLLLRLGGRALVLGQGADLIDACHSCRDGSGRGIQQAVTAAALAAPEDDLRWQRLTEAWQAVVADFAASEPDLRVARFLRYAALAQPIDALSRADGPDDEDPRRLPRRERVALMSVHSAKGLEWPIVFLVGVEDDKFPFYRARGPAAVAEERRLLYVGMTRAQDRLFLFSAERRNGYSKERSPFLAPLVGPFIDELRPSRDAANPA